jgi:hypothetical protein
MRFRDLIDAGISPDDYEEPGRPHCARCGAFLPPLTAIPYTYGYPGEEHTDQRVGAVCTKCGGTTYCD